MPSGDLLVRATAAGGRIRALAARTTGLVEEARRRHGTTPTATAALGRVLTATALLAATLDEGQSVTVRVLGSGPLGAVVAVGDTAGNVRGYVQHPGVLLPLNPQGKLDVGRAVGLPGYLHVTRDLGLREPYTGSVPLVSGEIGEDLTSYFFHSEQIPSLVSLGVLVAPDGTVLAAGGFFVQLLPGAEEQWAERLTRNAAELTGISRRIEAGLGPEDIVATALAGFEPRIHARKEIRFRCRCSRERTRALLAALGPDELDLMLAEDGAAELRCHFCNESYRFDGEELRELIAGLRGRREDG